MSGPAPLRAVEELDFDELFRRFAPYVARIGHRLLGDAADADDLIQDVFANAYRKRRQLRDPEAARAWLATSAVRRARRMLRARKLRRWLGAGEPVHYMDVADLRVSASDRMWVGAVYEVLDRLPVAHRVAWVLRHVEGLRLDEVAAASACSLATTKRRIKAAHDALRKELGDG